MGKNIAFFDDPTDFSLVQGGPLFQLLISARLLKAPTDLVLRRIIAISLVAWLPLLLLSTLAGHAVGGVAIPFLFDVGAHARLLGCVPLLIAAEVVAHRRIKAIVNQFLEQGLVGPEERTQFESVIASAMRLRNSAFAEVLLLGFAVTIGWWTGKHYLSTDRSTWHTTLIGEHAQVTAAGYWYFFVSMTIFRLLLIRWWFRLFIWYRFIWQVAHQIPLRLNPLHPDRAGGLGFLSQSTFAFLPVMVAHTIALAGIVCGKIWFEGATLPQFKLEIAAWMLFLFLLVVAPLFVFVNQLANAKRAGLREYGILAGRYVTEFRRKWFEGHAANDESLIGTADIQSLADLSNSFEVMREMNLVPLSKRVVLKLVLLIGLPLFPLALTMISLDQLIERAVNLFFRQ